MATRKPVAAPEDHKPKAEKKRPEETPGWELLKPMSEIPVWDQTPLIALLHSAMDDVQELSDEEYAKLSARDKVAYDKSRENVKSFDVNIVGQLAKALIAHAVDEEAYTKFMSGPQAMQRAMALAMAWVGQMGESEGSETS